MANLLKRIERLESNAPRLMERARIVLQFVGAENGKPIEWAPTWAAGADAPNEPIYRGTDESAEAFERRASEHFKSDYMIGGGVSNHIESR